MSVALLRPLLRLSPTWRALVALVAGALGYALLLLPGWGPSVGLLIVGVLLPGTLAAAWWLRGAYPAPAERVAYSVGLGYVLYILALLGVTMLPGPLVGWQVIAALTLLWVALGVGWGHSQRAPAQPLPAPETDVAWGRWGWGGLAVVVAVGALLRLPNLGYADFQGDEARAMLRASEILQGYGSALLIHKKGPVEILLPAGLYAVQGAITEAQARLPFALANLLGLLAIYTLGRQWVGPVGGAAAALLLAVDGYLIGFARIVQYQSVVFALSVVVLLALWRQARADRPRPAYLLIAGLAGVGGLFAHYEAAWVLIPGVYLLWHYGARTGDWRGLWHALRWPALLTVGLLLAFFLPFVLDQRWERTTRDLFGNRIGTTFPYNNLTDFWERTTIYSSTYYVGLLLLGALASQALAALRVWPRAGWLVVGLTAAGLGMTLARPTWLVIGGEEHTWLFFAVAVAATLLASRLSVGARAAWLWFGLPMILSLFFVAKPNSHVYGFFFGWALVTGIAAQAGWQALAARWGALRAAWLALPVTAALLLLLGNYARQMFTRSDVEVLRAWTTNRPAGYWTTYDLPTRGSLFGFPYKNGWKVIGALYADGTLDAPFDSNETSRVGEWYGRGLYVCPPDAAYYMLPTTLQPDEQLEDAERVAELAANGFHPWGVVTVGGDPRLQIFHRGPSSGPLRVFAEEEYAPRFDAQLSGPAFLKNGPVIPPQWAGPSAPPSVYRDVNAQPAAYRVGEQFTLTGYSLSTPIVAPGDPLEVRLYWEVDRASDDDYKVFVQVIDLATTAKIAQRDSEPGCTVYAVDEWRVGETNLDPYFLTIAPDAAPGRYTVLAGMYTEATQTPLPAFAADGTPLGNAIPLTTLEVVAP